MKLFTARGSTEIRRCGHHGRMCPRFSCCQLRLHQDLGGQPRVFLYECDIMRKSVTLFYVTQAPMKAPARLPGGSSNLLLQPGQTGTASTSPRGCKEPPGAARLGGTQRAVVSPKISFLVDASGSGDHCKLLWVR